MKNSQRRRPEKTFFLSNVEPLHSWKSWDKYWFVAACTVEAVLSNWCRHLQTFSTNISLFEFLHRVCGFFRASSYRVWTVSLQQNISKVSMETKHTITSVSYCTYYESHCAKRQQINSVAKKCLLTHRKTGCDCKADRLKRLSKLRD